jgi:cephalosporin hydroxylase
MKDEFQESLPITYDIVSSDEIHWQMSLPERFVFTDLLQKIHPKVAIEVGTRYGGSLRVISMFSEKVFSLDFDPGVQDHIQSIKNFMFISGDSRITFPNLLGELSKENLPLEFVLIDADHSYEGVRQDMNSLLGYIPVRSLYFLLHDSYNPDCRKGMMSADWPENPYIHYLELDYVPGFLLGSQKHYRQMWGD